jgi:hypothetical protein
MKNNENENERKNALHEICFDVYEMYCMILVLIFMNCFLA